MSATKSSLRIHHDGIRAYARLESPDIKALFILKERLEINFEIDLSNEQLMLLVRDIAEVLYGHFKLEQTNAN